MKYITFAVKFFRTLSYKRRFNRLCKMRDIAYQSITAHSIDRLQHPIRQVKKIDELRAFAIKREGEILRLVQDAEEEGITIKRAPHVLKLAP